MLDTIIIDQGKGRVDITVQTRDAEGHSALSNLPKEDWEQIRRSVRWLIDGALARRKVIG